MIINLKLKNIYYHTLQWSPQSTSGFQERVLLFKIHIKTICSASAIYKSWVKILPKRLTFNTFFMVHTKDYFHEKEKTTIYVFHATDGVSLIKLIVSITKYTLLRIYTPLAPSSGSTKERFNSQHENWKIYGQIRQLKSL